MTYHSNHVFCNESIWEGEEFWGEAVVSIEQTVKTDNLDENKFYIENPDFKNLLETEEVFDKSSYDISWPFFKKALENKGEEITDEVIEFSKKPYMRKVPKLKKEVFDWLESEVKDKINSEENPPMWERKGWAVGTGRYNIAERKSFNIFFERQKDALEFIKKWSIYKSPTFYFDYFHEDKREMSTKEIVDVTNQYLDENRLDKIDIGDKIKIPHKIPTELKEESFLTIDWETEQE